MTELVNTFSWSISARDDFEECPRRRYWAKYAMWGGWKKEAGQLARTAYRLGKMENRFSLQGNAVERAVFQALRQFQSGLTPDIEKVYEAVAKPFLNQSWSDSRKKLWQLNPKQHCCLHEHYYPAHHQTPEPEMTARMIAVIKIALGYFIEKVLPRLAQIKPENEVAVAHAGAGDPESFDCEGIKVYAIPDYVYRLNDRLHIHDWKAGNPRAAHKEQMLIYGLWAHTRLGCAPETIDMHLEYLARGATENMAFAADDPERARALVRESAGAMAEYLVAGDMRRNEPLPKEDWELCAETDVCRRCNFYELCRPELESA